MSPRPPYGGQRDNRRRRERAAVRLPVVNTECWHAHSSWTSGSPGARSSADRGRPAAHPPSGGLSARADPVSPHPRDGGRPRLLASERALSHPSAAQLWGFLPYPADPGLVHVSVAGRNPGRHPGIRVHRTTSLRHGEVTVRHGIGVTTPARTILDLAGELSPVARWSARSPRPSRFGSRTEPGSFVARPAPGATRDRGAEETSDAHAARTRSPAEELLLSLIRASELPEPHVNARLGDWEVDFLWAAAQLVVEVDGFASHSSPEAFERDHAEERGARRRPGTSCFGSPGVSFETSPNARSPGSAARSSRSAGGRGRGRRSSGRRRGRRGGGPCRRRREAVLAAETADHVRASAAVDHVAAGDADDHVGTLRAPRVGGRRRRTRRRPPGAGLSRRTPAAATAVDDAGSRCEPSAEPG